MFLVLSSFALAHYYVGERENVIQNNCDFDILRIKKSEVMCADYGKHVKYCNHYSQPEEFLIYNENSINGKNIVIKPYAIWEENYYNKEKKAEFYYTFTCDKRDNFPKLIQKIYPMPGHDNNPFILFIVFIILIICIYLICPLNNSRHMNNSGISNNFFLGYVLGNRDYETRRIYTD